MNYQNESQDLKNKQNQNDFSFIEKKIRILQLEKKRNDKRNNQISKILKNSRNKLSSDQISRRDDSLMNLEKQIYQKDNSIYQMQSESNYTQTDSLLNQSQKHEIDEQIHVYQSSVAHNYQYFISQVDQQVEEENIESFSQILDQVNSELQLFQDEILVENIIIIENKILFKGLNKYQKEPYIQYLLVTHLNSLLDIIVLKCYYDLGRILLRDLNIFKLFDDQIDQIDITLMNLKIITKCLGINHSFQFLASKNKLFISVCQKIIRQYNSSFEVMKQFFEILTLIFKDCNNSQNISSFISTIDEIPLNKIYTFFDEENIDIHQFILIQVHFYLEFAKLSFLSSQKLIFNGVFEQIGQILLEILQQNKENHEYLLKKILKFIIYQIKNDSLNAVDIFIQNKIISFQSNQNKILVPDYSLFQKFVDIFQQEQYNSYEQAFINQKMLKIIILLIKNCDINMHLPKLIEGGCLILLQDIMKQVFNQENEEIKMIQNNQFEIREKIIINLLDTTKYLFQLLKIYYNKFLELNSNQKTKMLDENYENQLNTKYWLKSIYYFYNQYALINSQFVNKTQNKSIQNKIQEIQSLQMSFIAHKKI